MSSSLRASTTLRAFKPRPTASGPFFPRRPYSSANSIPPSPSLSTPKAKSSRFGSPFLLISTLLALPTAYLYGAFYPPSVAYLISPRSAPPSPAHDSPEGVSHTREIEEGLNGLEVVKEMRSRSKDGEWYECRPYSNLPPARLAHSLTAGTLRGPGKLAVPPIVFAKEDESEAVLVVHFGRSLCGHDGIVHGGLLATVFDEATARNALLNLPTNIGVTANLSINYRAPTRADQYVIVRTRLTELKGRKAVISATMEDLGGVRLADATAVFIEPKWAGLLENSGVREILGKKPVAVPAVPVVAEAK